MNASTETPDPGVAHARPRRELLWAAFAIAFLAVVFLWNPISRIRDSTYSPVDFMQELPLTHVQRGWHPGNQFISDVVVEYHPWFLFSRDLLHQGKLPLWNRYNGFGVPHHANFQSAMFSPLTWCFYVFPFKLAVLGAAFLKLFALGYFTYLFLRVLRLAPIACFFGAVVYTYAAHNILRLGYSQSSVAMMLPAGLWAIERLAQGWESARRRLIPPRGLLRVENPALMATFVAVLVLGIFLGHPETFYFSLGGMVLYAAARVFTLWRDHRGTSGAMRALRALGTQLTIAGVLAALIASVHLLPFFEYLSESFIFGDRTGGGQTPLPAEAWSTLAFPNLLGNPANAYFVDYNLPLPDFDTATLAYAGSLAMLLAILAPFFVRKRRALTFFFVMGVVWVVYAYGMWGTQPLFELVPTLKMVPINRSQIVFHICVAVCGAFLVDRLVDRREEPERTASISDGARAVVMVTSGLLLLAIFRTGANTLAAETWKLRENNPARQMIPTESAAHMDQIGFLLIAGVVCAALAWIARTRVTRLFCAGALVVAAYSQTGHLLAGYNPITPDRMVYPVTPWILDLKATVAGERHVFLGPTALPPHTNSVYGIESLPVWDGISIRRFELLRRRLFSPGGNWQETRWATTRGLQLFGITMLIDDDGWIDVDTALGFVDDIPEESFNTSPIVPGSEVEMDFTGFDDGFSAIRLCFSSGGRPQAQTFDVTLTDKATGEVIVSRKIEPPELDPLGRDRVYGRLVFPAMKGSAERLFNLRVASPDGTPDSAWSLVVRKDYGWMANRALWRHEGFLEPPGGKWHERILAWQTRQSTRTLHGHLAIDMQLGLRHFETAGRVGPYNVFKYKDAVPRFHTVTRAWLAADEEEAWKAVLRLGFDPGQMVVLEGVDKALLSSPVDMAEPDANEPVEILREDNGHLELRTTRSEPGWLVLAQPWYPGWKARVNGIEKPIVRANHAFSAVRLERGASRVDLDYEPASFTIGALVSAASALAFALWMWASARSLRRT